MILKEEPKVRFLIAGDGPERENLKRKQRIKIRLTVHFLGRIPHEEMPDLLLKQIFMSQLLYMMDLNLFT